MICVKCGRKCQDGNFCSICGARQDKEGLLYDENLEPDEDLESDQDPQWRQVDYEEAGLNISEDRKRLAAFIGIGVLIVGILVLLGALIMGAFGGKGKGDNQLSEVQTTEGPEEERQAETTEIPDEESQAETTEIQEEESESWTTQYQTTEWESEEMTSPELDTEAPTSISPEEEKTESSEGIIFPDSSSTLISQEEIEGLSDSELKYAINEIYARNGYIFSTEALQKYYEKYDWYSGKADADHFSEGVFNTVEQENLSNLIGERERRN